MRKGILTLTAAVVVAAIGFWAWQRTNPDAGTITFEFVPKQAGAPVTVMAIALRQDQPWSPEIIVRNDSSQTLRSVTPAVLIATPDERRARSAAAVAVAVAPGQSATITVSLPPLWQEYAWREYPRGAVFTLGLASTQLEDGVEWLADVAAARDFRPSPEITTRPGTGGIGRLPWWQFAGASQLTFSNSASAFPINGSLDDGGCTMSFCERGFCEFNGCAVKP